MSRRSASTFANSNTVVLNGNTDDEWLASLINSMSEVRLHRAGRASDVMQVEAALSLINGYWLDQFVDNNLVDQERNVSLTDTLFLNRCSLLICHTGTASHPKPPAITDVLSLSTELAIVSSQHHPDPVRNRQWPTADYLMDLQLRVSYYIHEHLQAGIGAAGLTLERELNPSSHATYPVVASSSASSNSSQVISSVALHHLQVPDRLKAAYLELQYVSSEDDQDEGNVRQSLITNELAAAGINRYTREQQEADRLRRMQREDRENELRNQEDLTVAQWQLEKDIYREEDRKQEEINEDESEGGTARFKAIADASRGRMWPADSTATLVHFLPFASRVFYQLTLEEYVLRTGTHSLATPLAASQISLAQKWLQSTTLIDYATSKFPTLFTELILEFKLPFGARTQPTRSKVTASDHPRASTLLMDEIGLNLVHQYRSKIRKTKYSVIAEDRNHEFFDFFVLAMFSYRCKQMNPDLHILEQFFIHPSDLKIRSFEGKARFRRPRMTYLQHKWWVHDLRMEPNGPTSAAVCTEHWYECKSALHLIFEWLRLMRSDRYQSRTDFSVSILPDATRKDDRWILTAFNTADA